MIAARVRWLRALGLVVVFATVCAGCDWPMFGLDPEHSSFAPFETTITTANVSQLVTKWVSTTGSATNTTPAIANGDVYVGSFDGALGHLDVFSASGTTNCLGTPQKCAPLWTATVGSPLISSPAVGHVNNSSVVYVVSRAGTLYAFDAAGVTNCSGTPKTCTPLWTGSTIPDLAVSSASTPNFRAGVVYVGGNTVYAFDGAGVKNCSGTPRTWTPLWSGPSGLGVGSPATSNAVLYAASADTLYAFDITGTTNSCFPVSGQIVCQPLWQSSTTAPPPFQTAAFNVDGSSASPTVAGSGVGSAVYIPVRCLSNCLLNPGSEALGVFDANGVKNCNGTPKVCSAELYYLPFSVAQQVDQTQFDTTPAVSNTFAYVGATNGKMYAFNVNPNTFRQSCVFTIFCLSPWSGATNGAIESSVAAQPGVVFTGSTDGHLYAFDSAGQSNCSGSPATCAPLFTTTLGGAIGQSSPAISNGQVFMDSSSGVTALGLP